MNNIDSIILGHNQFIGVNHFSQDKARNRSERFSDIEKIIDIIKYCVNLDVKGMMLSTHPKSEEILKNIRVNGLSKEMHFYPLIPYAQGYVRKMNEKGIPGLLNDILKPAGISMSLDILLSGGLGYVKKDMTKMLKALIDLELIRFKNLNIKAVFLHNMVTDLALALGAEEQFKFFINYIKSHYDTYPAFATANFTLLMKSFNKWGIKRPFIMSSFNKIGFEMNPSRESNEKCLRENNVDVLAMNTLAAGYLNPKEAFKYVFSLPKIKSIVIGVSTKEHAEESINMIRSKINSSPPNECS